MEQRLARRMGPLVKKETTYPSLIPLHVWLVGQETKEACFEDGKRRLVGLGWEDRRLGDDQMGWGNEWLGEGLPNKLVQKYARRHRDVLDKSTVAGVDKEKVSEAKLREYICGMESGPKIVEVCDNDGKIQRFVSLLALGPNGAMSMIGATSMVSVEGRERPGQPTAAASLRGVEVEVSSYLTFND